MKNEESGFGADGPQIDRDAPEAYAVGDVVMLRSGGPQMTIREIQGDGAICEWFDGADHRERRFTIATLRPIGVTDDPSKIFEKMSDAARGVFDELKERAKSFTK